MLNSQEEVLCFYTQDIIYACRNLKEKILLNYRNQYFKKINTDVLKELNFDIEEVLDFVTSLPKVYTTRNFIVTGANNDQVYIENWQYLKETFQGYMDKISKHLKFYYENIGKFYNMEGKLDETIVLHINKKKYKYNDVCVEFNLAINYMFDISPLVYYDKFRDPLR
jgi:hypothetical protein